MSSRIPFLDVRAVYEELRDEIDEAIGRVVGGGNYILGPEVEAFEEAFARFIGTKHCVGVGSGMAALQLALEAIGVHPGDEVIVPSNTFVGTWMAVSLVGATPVPVEPSDRTYNIDPTRVEAAITARTTAIIPVHLYGQPAAMDPIRETATRHGLAVLEDAAQAHGSRIGSRRAGSFGAAAAFSFYPGKNLGAMGDGGAITTDDDAIADRARLLRNFGARTKFANETISGNNRLDELQAAVLRVKLDHLDEWNERRQTIASLYLAELAGTDLVLPFVEPDMTSNWHLFVVRSDRRDQLGDHLSHRGITPGVHYPVPPHRQAAYAGLQLGPGSLPVSERLHSQVLSLPMGPHLDKGAARTVVEAVLAFNGTAAPG